MVGPATYYRIIDDQLFICADVTKTSLIFVFQLVFFNTTWCCNSRFLEYNLIAYIVVETSDLGPEIHHCII